MFKLLFLYSALFFATANAQVLRQIDGIQNTSDGSLLGVPSIGSIFLSDTSTATVTNKTLSGSSNTFTNIPASALSSGQLGVANGGTGLSTLTQYGLLTGGTTSTGVFQQVSNSGATVGQVLTYNGSSALPTWKPASGTNTGLNYLLNASFEASTASTSWTVSGATASTGSDFHDGAQSISLALSAGGSLVQSVTPTTNLSGNSMEAGLWVNTSTTGNLVCPVINGTVLSGIYCNAVPSSGVWSYVPTNFQGPTSGTSFGVALVWTATSGTILADQAYLGQATNQISVGNNTVWTSYTPTTTGVGTISSSSFSWRQVGPNMEISGQFTIGTPTAILASISLPDSAVIAASNGSSIYAAGQLWYGSTGAATYSMLATAGTSVLQIGIQNAMNSALTPQNGDFFFASSTPVTFSASVPIVGWTAQSPGFNSACGSTGACVNHLSASVNTVCSSDPCTIDSQTGNWIASINRSSSGAYIVNFSSGFFTVPPVCGATVGIGGGAITMTVGPTTTTTSTALQGLASNVLASDTNFTINCDRQGSDRSSTNAPVLMGNVTSDSLGSVRLEYARIVGSTSNCDTPVSSGNIFVCPGRNSGSWIGSLTYNVTGNYTVVFATPWPVPPSCVCNASDTGVTGNLSCDAVDGTTTTQATIVTTLGSSGNDGLVELHCMGPR